jgi:hypothetical protein
MPEGKGVAPHGSMDHEAKPAHCKLGCGQPLGLLHSMEGEGCPGVADGPIVQVHQVVQLGGEPPVVIKRHERMLLFLYLLLRDAAVPLGKIEGFALEGEGLARYSETTLSNPYLADYASNLLDRLTLPPEEEIHDQVIGYLKGRAQKARDEEANSDPPDQELNKRATKFELAAEALGRERDES